MTPGWCGECSWDGWIFTKDDQGRMIARRCPCWLARQVAGTLGDRHPERASA